MVPHKHLGKAHKDSNHTIVITVMYWYFHIVRSPPGWWSCECFCWLPLLTSTVIGSTGIIYGALFGASC